jgi:hypothetical protein
MPDIAYAKSRYRPPEIEHRYGSNVHLLDDPLAWTLLARLCSNSTQQPEIGRLTRALYQGLARAVLAAELDRARLDVPTRMVTSSPEAVIRSTGIARQALVVTVGIARKSFTICSTSFSSRRASGKTTFSCRVRPTRGGM